MERIGTLYTFTQSYIKMPSFVFSINLGRKRDDLGDNCNVVLAGGFGGKTRTFTFHFKLNVKDNVYKVLIQKDRENGIVDLYLNWSTFKLGYHRNTYYFGPLTLSFDSFTRILIGDK